LSGLTSPERKKEKLKVRAGAGSVETQGPNDTERKKTSALKELTEPYEGAARDERM
jgi:hypothetical protein